MHFQLIEKLNEALEKLLQNKPIDERREASEEKDPLAGEPELDELWAKLQSLQYMHTELQRFSVGLSKGELGTNPPPRNNYLAAGLKQLQMHLRHLSWQTQRISEGDYSQKVDFMGEFSEAFNKMVEQLRSRENNILTQRENMLRVFDQLEPVFIVSESEPTSVLYANKLANLRFHLDDDGEEKQALLLRFWDQCQPQTSTQIQDTDSSRWYRVSCERFFWDQEQDSLLYHCADITTHIKRENDLEHEAHTDRLTGLNNRYVFEVSFDKLWDTCRQNESPLSLIIFDIDFFKKYNDTYGHMQGDKCLIVFADILRSRIGRFNDVIARFGGEEFVALLPFTNQEAAVRIADTVRTSIEKTDIPLIEKRLGQDSIRFTVSGGVASCIPTFEAIPEELISAADKALYLAKQTGRNRICVAEPEPAGAAEGRAAEADIALSAE